MEADNVSRIPAPVYGRGFVKLYCEAVGLDAKSFIDEFMAIYTGTHDIGIRERSATPPPPPVPAAPEPPPAAPFLEQPFLTDAAVPPPPPPAAEEPPAFDIDDATASRSLSRYAAPVRQPKSEPTVSPAVWRISILGAIALLILWGIILGVRALYKATSDSIPPPETSTTTEIESPPTAQKPTPTPDIKATAKTERKSSESAVAKTATKPASPAQKTQRTPQKIPSLYLD